MKVLILSPYPGSILSTLDRFGDDYRITDQPVGVEYCREEQFDFVVSYGYRFIIKKDVLSFFKEKAVNLHISLLPHCRGAHPVFWSVFEQRPLGVTIHLLDEGLDTGKVLFQKVTPLTFTREETFASLYKNQRNEIERLFGERWSEVRTGVCPGRLQSGEPSEHRSIELNDWLHMMPQQWDTLVSDFCRKAGVWHPLIPTN